MTITAKDDAIQCHGKLFKTVENLLVAGLMTEEDASAYIKLGVLPQHVHKHKDKHWNAVHVLVDVLLLATSRAIGEPITKHEPAQLVEQAPENAPSEFPLDSVTPMNGHRPAQAPTQVAPIKAQDDLPSFARGKVTPRPDPRPAQVSS